MFLVEIELHKADDNDRLRLNDRFVVLVNETSNLGTGNSVQPLFVWRWNDIPSIMKRIWKISNQ